MRIKVLGAAAGGGFPQWNCACPNCRGVREGNDALRPLLQSSLAVSANAKDWYLINAGPDVHRQIESFSALHPGPGIRETPLAGVILTDAELDHTIGLLSLREGSSLTIYGTEIVRKSLQSAFPVIPMLQNYCSWEWQILSPDVRQRVGSLEEGTKETITVETVPVSKKAPLYARWSQQDDGSKDFWEVGLVFHNESSDRRLAYFPTLESITPSIESCLRKADILMVDGTFWSENELVRMGAAVRDSRSMGHLPISGQSGIAERLASIPAKRKIMIHINNSNPILKKDSIERYALEQLGFEVAYDGMEVEV
ncbi:pyrroloquinoline quinone biosynthesis protein PqqB [Bacillus sp. EB600]|uniref:pyrroloquinoline quinone biosynthesis protein PqqB n=1 Tax=Bacillus sp. EB600 TaxID=2806345 RepID=UPI0028128499|nr:pyrroloquinoline quinone biosynthesis protein PqqB [Bacillus sp. EB600]MCQ6281407.1 pyrroloquinoline quinone biosynthesis protein PqqB [Bacillus sp. EB600]